MTLPPTSDDLLLATTSASPRLPSPAQELDQVAQWLDTLESGGAAPASPACLLDTAELALENQLVQVRLGIASGLFAALRAKHPPTAHHCLRVALACSAWSAMLGWSDRERDELELAALLHDIGKIGVPDALLLKPAPLTPDEYQIVERFRQTGVDILRTCCTAEAVLQIVACAGAWFDGRREGVDLRGEQLPLAARMLAIVDAYDAMTSDQVYRRAMSQERALAELFEFAGSQFDPRLVQEFCTYVNADPLKLQAVVARRWLKELERATLQPDCWRLQPRRAPAAGEVEAPFYQKLLESMHDAVIFVDSTLKITRWNTAAERLTGITAASIEHKQWSPTLINLRDEKGRLMADGDCPVAGSIRSGAQTLRRLSITGRGGERIDVDVHVAPVHGKGGVIHGAAVLLHDASNQITLEQRIQLLHEKATRDPLTQVANRAELDRILASSLESHRERRLPCSLILCDIDHFKKINDTFGHQAGDDVLIVFAAMLRRHCRAGDLVARYGGEEFALLCTDCDAMAATRRAEQIRQELAEFPLTALGGRHISASFGVTQLQAGDTAETLLRRADRALYQAKANGRNTVVQLGSGLDAEEAVASQRGWWSWLRPTPPDLVLRRTLATSVPFNVVVEKLRGFVFDHKAIVETITEDKLVLRIEGDRLPLLRRASDRPVPFCVELAFFETETQLAGRMGARCVRTLVDATLRPLRGRDRRRRDVLERAQRLLASLKSYLIAQDQDLDRGEVAATIRRPVAREQLAAAAERWSKSWE